MKAPQTIYLTPLLVEGCGKTLSKSVTENDAVYISKDALLEWAEYEKIPCIGDYYNDGHNHALDLLIEKLNSL